AIDLGGVEDVIASGEDGPIACGLLLVVCLVAAPLGDFPEDDERRLLALSDLGPELLPLVVGRPLPRGVAVLPGEQPKQEDVDAAVGPPACDVHRGEAVGPGHVPRHAIPLRPTLHRLDDLPCDFRVNVWCLLVHGVFSYWLSRCSCCCT